MKTLFCLLLVLVCGSFIAQAQKKKTAQTIEIPASLKADTISKVTYTYKGKTYKQQAFIDLVYTKGVKEDKEYTAMINFLKAKKETNVVEKIESAVEAKAFAGLDDDLDESDADLKKLEQLTKKAEEITKKAEEITKKAEDAKEGAKMAEAMTQKMVGANLTQLSKDVENKVAGSEQKYVDYVDKYPALKTDAKVKVMYEKCKAKIKK
jgi:hypothetical protein